MHMDGLQQFILLVYDLSPKSGRRDTISLLFLHTAVHSRFQLVKLRVATDSLLVRGRVVSMGLFELRLHVLERLS
jgi:hypothetical protein